MYGMRKIGPVFWIQRTKQSVSLCQHPLTSGTLMFTGSMSFPQHSKHQTNNKLLFCVCSFSLRLVAKHFVSCQWDAGTFMIVSDCICKANSIFFLSFSSYNESSRSCYQRVEKAQHSNTQMPARVSGSVSQWLRHLLRALPEAFSSSCLIISTCE